MQPNSVNVQDAVINSSSTELLISTAISRGWSKGYVYLSSTDLDL